MKQKKWLIAVTAASLLATSAGVGANALVEKVSGLLHNDVKVTVDGSETALKPIYIDGKAYLPARETADLLGYNLNWSSKELVLKDRDAEVEEEAELVGINGVIVNIDQGNGLYSLEVMGQGSNQWIILGVDEKTEINSENGPVKPAELKPGMRIEAQYGPAVALSYPGRSYASTIEVKNQALVLEDEITGITSTGDGWQIQFSAEREGQILPSLLLNAGKETLLITANGEPVEWNHLYPGVKVKAYYGPALAKSMPPQSAAHVIIVEEKELTGEQVEAYREAAWGYISDEEKPTVETKPEEAAVEIVPARTDGIIGGSDEGKKALEALVNEEGQMIIVTYYTEMNELLGPLKVVLHPETKALLGYFARD
ncbi:hypothetical protein [Paenibacillus daejeonensis]|uniref:hypothetical protein n=1 Tax=Paenibacillus daejeonensis TaxID=135193 RepID=UPI00035C140F|nr:hypothetical protein [Paenibacillus daejeonensis]